MPAFSIVDKRKRTYRGLSPTGFQEQTLSSRERESDSPPLSHPDPARHQFYMLLQFTFPDHCHLDTA